MAGVLHSQQVEAVILRHMDWGEADRLITLYSYEQGKLRAVAKGARKLRSRKAGHLEPFTRVKLMLARGRDLWIVTQAETIDAYLPIRENLELLGYSSLLVELLDRFSYEEGQNVALYQLLVDSLSRLAQGEDPFTVTTYFQVRFLDHLGFRPDLFHCVMCGEEIQPQNQYFSPQEGGAVCPKCGKDLPGTIPVSMNALKFLRHYQRSSYKDAKRASIPRGIQQEMERLVQSYLTYLLERSLNSPDFLRRVRNRPVETDSN